MEDQAYRFAARSGKATLYKFRPHQSSEHREWVRQIIVEHKVYFSRASQLNDPFDMSPRLETVTRERLIAGANDHWSRHPEIPQEERTRLVEYFSSCDLAEHATTAQAKMRKRIEDGYSVFSLAGNRDHLMLWSHYAQGHTGLCVHFCAEEGSLFGASMGVIYSDSRPLVPVEVRSISERELFQRIIFHKGKFWEYEEEYRWPKFPDTDYSDLPIKFIGEFGHFPPSALSGITVGIRMPDRHVRKVLDLAASHNPRLPVWRALEAHSFALDFELLS